MKRCPHCRAAIEDNARFCLYCMTSLEEKQEIIVTEKKKKRWPIILAAFLALVLVVVSLGVGLKKCGDDNDKGGKTFSAGKSSKPQDKTGGDDDSNPSEGEPESNDGTSQGAQDDGDSNSGGAQGGGGSSNNGGTQSGGSGSGGTQGGGTSGGGSSGGTQSGTQTDGDTQAPTPLACTYIEAITENTYPPGMGLSYTPENSVVITKVNTVAADGVYVIPETIDGKKVAAIMPGAFSDPKVSKTVKSVTLPASVKTIWSGALETCYNLTDLYLKSPVVEIYKDSLPEVSKRNSTITIHCKKDCRNFNFYYYSNIANQYSAKYEEWNG